LSNCKRMFAVAAIAFLVAVPAAASVTIFEDNFDAYTAGVYPPAPWTNLFSGHGAVVSADQSSSAPNSFRSESDPNWARWDYVTLTIPDRVSYHARVYLTAADRGGAVGFGFLQPGTSNTGWWANAVYFGNDGNIYFNTRTAGSVVLGTWSPDRWYEVYVEIDYIAEVAVVFIDGGFVAGGIPTDPKTLPDTLYGVPVPLDQFGMFGQNFSGTGTSVIYYDDIVVADETAVPAKHATWGAIKAMFEEE